MQSQHSAPTPVSKLRDVTLTYFDPVARLPLVIIPETPMSDICEWASANRHLILTELDAHGAILFRGFGVRSAGELERFIGVTAGAALPYSERSSPRSRVEGNVYTSTDYEASQAIFLHNERSYGLEFPAKIYFCCLRPAESGGETPIADCRRIYRRLRADTIGRFADGYLYVRHYGAGLGMSWQEALQTHRPLAVERYCRDNQIECTWLGGNRLRTVQRRRAIAKHPRTGDMVWFNHLTFFHLTTLPPAILEVLRLSDPAELPNQTYHADGSDIEEDLLDELRAAYRAETTMFSWQAGDVLMLDNMLVAHGRRPFTGDRKIVVGMADECRWEDV